MKLGHINLAGEEYPVCFSLSAIEDIEDEFGSLDAMRERLTSGSAKVINRVLEIMLKAGRSYCVGMGIDCPPALKCRPGDLIDVRGGGVIRDIFAMISGDSERTVEVKAKN